MKTNKGMNRRLLFITVIICMVIMLMSQATINALVIGTVEPDQMTDTESLVQSYFENWEDDLLVTEYQFFEKDIIQIFFAVTSLDDPNFDPRDIFETLFTMLGAEDLSHQRVFIDIVDREGIKLISYDVDTNSSLFKTAAYAFDEENGESGDTFSDAPTGINEQFTIGDGTFVVTKFEVLDSSNGEYIKLYFDYTNNGDDVNSAFFQVDFFASQSGYALADHDRLDDDYRTTYADIAPGTTMRDCTVAFFLDNLEDPVSIRWQEFLGSETFTMELPVK